MEIGTILSLGFFFGIAFGLVIGICMGKNFPIWSKLSDNEKKRHKFVFITGSVMILSGVILSLWQYFTL